jgi:predicted O-linked N-acetylglucosamine transferase (SPINDLY family)
VTSVLKTDTMTKTAAQPETALLRLDELIQQTQTLQEAGRFQDALNLYEGWLSTADGPNKYVAIFNCASLLQTMGQMAQAEAMYRECLLVHPQLAQAAINLGLVLEKQGRAEEALKQWAQVVSQGLLANGSDKDMQVMALNHMGRLYENQKKYELAEQALRQSLGIDAKQTGVLQHLIHIRQKACKWPVYIDLPHISAHQMLMSTSPLAMLSLSDDPAQQLLCAHAFVGRTYSFKEEQLCTSMYHHDKIRIGYVSGDLCTHAVGLLLADFLEAHDRKKFEIHAYDFSPDDNTAYQARLRATFDHRHLIHQLSDAETARQILSDEIDVLVDLHGLSSGARPGIFALHPAPLQGTYLGFIGTTAMPWFDFVITDRYALHEELTPFFAEKPLYLDGSFIPLNKDDNLLRVASRSEFNFPDDAFVMAAFGNVYKINDALFTSWTNILKRSEKAILWLIDDNEVTTKELRHKAHLRGIADHQLVFSPRVTHSEYQSRIKLADVFLDSFPYNCGSTTRDVINCGTPIVTCSGRTMVSRMTGSILNSLDLNELITQDLQAYEDLIVELSQNSASVNRLKKSLAIKLDGKSIRANKLTRSFEKALLQKFKEQ